MSLKSKAFLELILIHSKKPKYTKERLKSDRRLTHVERNIIRGFLLMRDNENAEAYTIATSIKSQPDPMVESMRLYLLAGSLNNQGQYILALEFFQKCYQQIPKGIVFHLEYVILNNLFLIYMNLHNLVKAREILSILKSMSDLPQEDSLRFKRLEFAFYTAIEDEAKASELYKYLRLHQHQYTNHELVSLLIQFYHYGITFDHLQVCEDSVSQTCHQKKYSLTENFNYMRIMLSHLKEKTPIYLREQNFKNYPILLLQLKFIRALDLHKLSEASTLWNELHLLNPSVYKDEFQYVGFKSVFSRCLEMHHSKLAKMGIKAVKESHLSILDAIQQKLELNESVSREELFYYAYGRELESKIDQSLITKQVSKLKIEKKLEIRSVRGTYQLVKKAS